MSGTPPPPPEGLEQAKRAARAHSRAAVAALSPADRARWAAGAEALRATREWKRARVVLGFVPDGSEPPMRPLLQAALDEGKRLALPRMEWDEQRVRPLLVTDLEELEARRHGIGEPPSWCPAVDPSEIDLVLVPGVAFDRTGRRVGRGGGFYDRFLASLGGRASRVGVCFACQVVEAAPAGAHDERVTMLATEDGVEHCRTEANG